MAGSENSDQVPLLCLHMVPQSGQEFEMLMKLAGRDRLVIAPDYPGFGASDQIHDDKKISIETFANAVWQALDVLGCANVEVLGYHTGSKVGIEMALQFPDRVDGLCCISLSTMTPDQFASQDVSFSPLYGESAGSDLINWWHQLKSYYDPELPVDILVQKYSTSIKVGKRFHLGFKASHQYNANILEKLRCLTIPTKLINPHDDLKAITPLAAPYIPDCTFIDRPDWLPGFLETKPESVIEVLASSGMKLDESSMPAGSLAAS